MIRDDRVEREQPVDWSENEEPAGERTEDRRERILHAALEVFACRGFHQAQLDEIAKAAGVGKGTIYRYVPDKEGLLLEAIRHAMQVHERRVRERVEAARDTRERLYQLFYQDLAYFRENETLARVFFAERAALGFGRSFTKGMAELRQSRRKLLLAVLGEGQRDGTLRQDVAAEHLAHVVMGMVGGVIFDVLFDDGPPFDPEEAAQTYLELFLRGAGTP